MAKVEINGAALEVVESGAGDPVMFVHGSASDYRTWGRQLDVFAERYRAIAYSRRYHWPNAKIADGASYALAEHVDDLARLLRALDAAPAHLVGHSYGGLVCLLLAAKAPGLVRSLVLGEPPVMTLLVSIPPRPIGLLKLALCRPGLAAGIVRLGACGLARAASALERGDTEAAMQAAGTAILGRQALESLSQERAAQVRDNLMKEELVGSEALPPLDAEQVRKIERPVLLVGGARSPRVFSRLLDHLEAMLPRSERTEIPGASHLMHEDNAPEFNKAALAFLSKQGPAADRPA